MGKRDWESGHEKIVTHVDFFLLSWVLPKPHTVLNRLNYNLNCLKLHPEMTPFTLKWILLSQILYSENISFSLELFWILILTQTCLTKIKKKEISQSILALVESNIAFQTRIFKIFFQWYKVYKIRKAWDWEFWSFWISLLCLYVHLYPILKQYCFIFPILVCEVVLCF